MNVVTFKDIVTKFKSVQIGAIILIDGKEHRVIQNIHDDVVFLVQRYDESKSFLLYYEEMNPFRDNFTIIA